MIMHPQPVPTGLEKTDQRQLRITWSDGIEQLLPFRAVRDGCQCATCGEKRKAKSENVDPTSLPVLTEAGLEPLDIVRMRPVGNYAYNIQFSDGHTTGVFTFELLRSLSG